MTINSVISTKNFLSGCGGLVVKGLANRPDDMSAIPGPTWLKRTSSHSCSLTSTQGCVVSS